MDVSPHELRTAELREAWRGYRQSDVDALLDRCAGTIERLEAQVQRLSERLAHAEDDVGMSREADEMLRRTLLLAQRTADAAVAEAQERARQLVADAESDARRFGDSERQRIGQHITDLATTRDTLSAEVEALQRIADDHRTKLREVFEAQLAALERHALPEPPAIPPPATVDLAAVAAVAAAEPTEAGETQAEETTAGGGLGDEPTRALSAEEMSAEEIAAELAEDDDVKPAAVIDIAEPLKKHAAPKRASADLLPSGDTVDLDDDDFFAELRAAVEDNAPLGPRDDDEQQDDGAWAAWAAGESELFDQDASGEPKRTRSVFKRRESEHR